MHGGVQSGGPVDTCGVDVAPLPDEGSDGREIAPLRGIGQRNARRHRDGRQQPSDQDCEGENVSRRHLGILSGLLPQHERFASYFGAVGGGAGK
jgi:hypothetical protein